jgi:hypothetical protein
MFRILLLTIALAATRADIIQPRVTQDSDCPQILMVCPLEMNAAKIMKFNVKVTGGKRLGELTYRWTVSKGTIKSGQGTATIEVDLEGKNCPELTATVEVGGVDPNCQRLASCTTCIP